jgi:DNA-binding winged helix-turn-helix (wHTH) protein/Flp pilus assembly protein TadD
MYEFGGYRVGSRDRTVYRCGEIVPLPPKAVDVLIELLRNAGSVVPRETLIETVWPDTFVEESNLTQMIFLLRKALADAPDSGRIVTASRRGYSFLGAVRTSQTEAQSTNASRGFVPDCTQGAHPRALALLRKARYLQRKQTPDALFSALRYFRAAAGVDCRFGEAFAGIAETLATLEYVGGMTAEASLAEAEAAGLQAVRLRPESPHAQLALGLIELFFRRDVHESKAFFERALKLAGEDSHIILNCACYPQALGRLEEALEARKKAEDLDPFSSIAMQEVGWPLYLLRRYREALAQFRKVVELEPAWHAGYCGLGKVRVQQHQFSEAVRHFRKAVALSNGNGAIQALLAHAYARDGRRDEAVAILESLTSGTTQTRAGWFSIALIHAGLGNSDQAFQSLERACAARESAVLSLRTEPMLDDLRTDRRFWEMLTRLEFPD